MMEVWTFCLSNNDSCPNNKSSAVLSQNSFHQSLTTSPSPRHDYEPFITRSKDGYKCAQYQKKRKTSINCAFLFFASAEVENTYLRFWRGKDLEQNRSDAAGAEQNRRLHHQAHSALWWGTRIPIFRNKRPHRTAHRQM